MRRLLPVLLLAVTVLAVDVSGQNDTLLVHNCDPGTEPFVCSVASFVYNSAKKQHSRLIHTGDNRNVRLGFPRSKILNTLKTSEPTIPIYDAKLHEELNRPPAVQISNARMRKLEIPLDLQYSDFSRNKIAEVMVPEPKDSGSQYALRYLDLTLNSLSSIEKLHVLVNLETLVLVHNNLETLESTVFSGMHKLSMLVLSGNDFDELQFTIFPPSLVWLWLDGCYVSTLHMDGAHLPALETFSATDNSLRSLNVSMLQTMAPVLEEILLSENLFNKETSDALKVALEQAGIAHDGIEPYGEFMRVYFPGLHRNMADLKDHLESWDAILSATAVVVNLLCIVGWVGHRIWQMKSQRRQLN
ncbi:uncharacterized protein LOC126569790 [Anopheles aquasalis]|uniref:uncharacterized protein LOC126569790 n=1 Tax=Anopheles aquasalis TaxID=42839 RepID=UPI00215A583B|nr:uncharacterized protein LOC126569790 [Anopheles aquasalis]